MVKKRIVYNTVSEATHDLYQRGYVVDFAVNVDEECLYCGKTGTRLSPGEFEIDEIHRFEGMTDPGDEMIVYAISSKKFNVKGTVVNAFGPYSDTATSAIVSSLNAPSHPES